MTSLLPIGPFLGLSRSLVTCSVIFENRSTTGSNAEIICGEE